MINTRKFINPLLKSSNNIFEDVLVPITKREGFIKNQSPTIPIYFYRYIGIKENESEFYDDLYKLDEKLYGLGKLYLKLESRIPPVNNPDIMNKIQGIWKEITGINNYQMQLLIKLLRQTGCFPKLNSELFDSSIEESFSYTLDLYIKNSSNINTTQLKNFTLKFLGWINEYIPNLIGAFNYKNINENIKNPKVLYYGEIKKHEAYFLIFLSRIGCDVIYINTQNDETFTQIDRRGECSKVFNMPKRVPLKKLECKNMSTDKERTNVTSTAKVNAGVRVSPSNGVNLQRSKTEPAKYDRTYNMGSQKAMISSLKKSSNILKDIILPVNSRIGFSSGEAPIIPTYFYRYIGIKENEDEYYNELYKLDKDLALLGNQYVKFTSNIPVISDPNLSAKTQNIWGNITPFEDSKKDILISALIQGKAFPEFNDKVVTFSIIKAFNEVLELYLSNDNNINISKIKNFTLKILMWINKYVPKLLKSNHYVKEGQENIFNPKIMYYGDIKKHEVYFLILLSKLGCDIIYINSEADNTIPLIDKSSTFSYILELSRKEPLKEFPKEEVYIRQETTAYKASEELSRVLYNDEDGLYKPWQFENYKTKHVTLKTTYSELKLLWNEEAKFRTGFKIENNTVYIPNLLAKVSGVHEDLNEYFKDFAFFKSSENSIYIPKIPFTETNYTKNELYTLIRLFNKEGQVDNELLKKDRLYKFAYLKTSLQDLIIDKINYLLKQPIFKNHGDSELKLKILMTILNLDKKILELIQQFDYPAKIPKLVILDNDENIFSDEDAVIITFLNLIGFDILIITPTGYNNIEEKILDKHYDNHKLETIKLDLSITDFNNAKGKSKGFWKSIFGK